MAIESRLATAAGAAAIRVRADYLLTKVKRIKNFDLASEGRIFSKPVEVIVSLETAKGTLATLSRLCDKVDAGARPSIADLLEKAKQKIQFAEKVMDFVLSQQDTYLDPSNSLDPRIERILSKLTQMQQAPPPQNATECMAIHQKLNRYFEKTCKVYYEHPLTDMACDKAISIIGELEVRLLQVTPLLDDFDLNLFSSQHDYHYENPAGKKMAGASYSVIYLNRSMIETIQDGRCGCVGFGAGGEAHAHEWTAAWIRENPSKKTLSLNDAVENYYGHFLMEVPCTERQTPLSYPSNADEKEIQRQLDTLIELKNSAEQPMGALIEIGSHTLAIVFHISGRISLFNPYGREGLFGNNAYEIHFGNTGQVAEDLKILTAEMGPDKAVTLKPYRNREGKVGAESSESSEEDNNVINKNVEIEDPFTDISF